MTTKYEDLASVDRSYAPAPLLWWAERIEGDLKKALRVLGQHSRSLPEEAYVGGQAIRKWFGEGDEHHCFSQSVEPWLALTETQVMSGLAYHLNKHGKPALLAFLRAAAPGEWPQTLESCQAEVEVLVPRSGCRIDMLVSATYGGQKVGVVIEAKLGSTLRDNPLADYRRFIRDKRGMVGDQTIFIILDVARCRETDRRLARNKGWKTLSWHVFLVRLEKELRAIGITDLAFAAHRHRIWRRL